jgi:hypothetical protein
VCHGDLPRGQGNRPRLLVGLTDASAMTPAAIVSNSPPPLRELGNEWQTGVCRTVRRTGIFRVADSEQTRWSQRRWRDRITATGTPRVTVPKDGHDLGF